MRGLVGAEFVAQGLQLGLLIIVVGLDPGGKSGIFRFEPRRLLRLIIVRGFYSRRSHSLRQGLVRSPDIVIRGFQLRNFVVVAIKQGSKLLNGLDQLPGIGLLHLVKAVRPLVNHIGVQGLHLLRDDAGAGFAGRSNGKIPYPHIAEPFQSVARVADIRLQPGIRRTGNDFGAGGRVVRACAGGILKLDDDVGSRR